MKVKDLKMILSNLNDDLDIEMPDGLPLTRVSLSPDGTTAYLSDVEEDDVVVVWQEQTNVVN